MMRRDEKTKREKLFTQEGKIQSIFHNEKTTNEEG